MGYRVGQRLVAPQWGKVLTVSQVYEGDGGVWQVVLRLNGVDFCRATEADVRVTCYEMEAR
jgi:hypothetical protein